MALMAVPFSLMTMFKGPRKQAPNQLAQYLHQVTQPSHKPGQSMATLTPYQESSPILGFPNSRSPYFPTAC